MRSVNKHSLINWLCAIPASRPGRITAHISNCFTRSAHMKKTGYLLILIFMLACGERQHDFSEADKIKVAVENNLQPIIQFSGETDSTYSLEERMNALKVTGVSIAVAKGKEVIFSGTYGFADVERQTILTPETLLSCCSVSKTIAMTRILQLVEDGHLNLDEDVNTYLTDWKIPKNKFTDTEKVTIRRLLEHYSGMNARGGTEFKRDENMPTVIELLNGVNTETAPAEVIKVPGTGYEYSANNYLILQQVINEIDGSFEQSVTENIFKPLGMETSTYTNPFHSDHPDHYATGYTDDGQPIPEKWTIRKDLAAAGLWTTSEDLIKLISDIQFSLQNRVDGILSVEMAEALDLEARNDHHLGFITSAYTFGHPGGCTGFSAMILAWKNEPYSLAITMNGMSEKLRNELIHAIAHALELPTEFFKPKVFRVIELPDESLNRYVGVYEPLTEKEAGAIVVEKSGEGLRFHFSKLETPTVIRALNDSVFVDESGYEHIFRIQDNNVTGFRAWDFFETEKIDQNMNNN